MKLAAVLRPCALLVALLAPLACPGNARSATVTGNTAVVLSVQHVVVVNLARTKFMAALESFAGEHGFDYGIAFIEKHRLRESYRIELRRSDALIVVENPGTPAQYTITLLGGDRGELSADEANRLAGQLRQAIVDSESGRFTDGPDGQH